MHVAHCGPLQAGAEGSAEHDVEVLAGFLAKLSAFDTSMNQVVVDAGVLAGGWAMERCPCRRGCTSARRAAACSAHAAGRTRRAQPRLLATHSAHDPPLRLLLAGHAAGMSMQEVAAAGSAVALQPGCAQVLSQALATGIPTHILSVNWSSAFVAAALGLPAHTTSG